MIKEIFPFYLNGHTQFYLDFYFFTLLIHFLFMNYVLFGTAFIAWVVLFNRTKEGSWSKIVFDMLRDWMPFMLSGAITAGIAPLLFIQILYKKEFYSANLLLFNRWMSILPVLIIGFYTLYLLKSKNFLKFPSLLQKLIGLIPFLCFFYTGYAWSENHALSNKGQDFWVQFYYSAKLFFFEPSLIFRMALWMIFSLPIFMPLLLLQFSSYKESTHKESSKEKNQLNKDYKELEVNKLKQIFFQSSLPKFLALLGLLASSLMLVGYFKSMDVEKQTLILSPQVRPYLLGLGVLIFLQIITWIFYSEKNRILVSSLTNLFSVLTIFCVLNLREFLRVASFSQERMTELAAIHTKAFATQGFVLFLGMFVLNLLLIFYCIRIVRASR